MHKKTFLLKICNFVHIICMYMHKDVKMCILKHIFNLFYKNKLVKPLYDYYFLLNLEEIEYPKYLAKMFKLRTGETLPLCFEFKIKNWVIDKNKCKTFNQKIQWIKLYGITDLMRKCTDKVLVREYVSEKIGSEYLKPAIQIIYNCSPSTGGRGRGEGIALATKDVSTCFDQIDFDKLPDSFVIKCNHGCKWHYIIKNKEKYLSNKKLVEITKRQITGWLEQEFWAFGGFEMQYKNLKPKIIIEPLLRDEININPREIEIYCFNGIPKIYVNVKYGIKREITFYNEDFSFSDLILHPDGNNEIKKEEPDDLLKHAVELSRILCLKNPSPQPSPARGEGAIFNFVRTDWLIYKNKLYFNELTFTPYSGFIKFDKKWNKKLGSWLEI